MTLEPSVVQRASHAGLLNLEVDVSRTTSPFDAIIMPASRPVPFLRDAMEIAVRTDTLMVVICSQRAHAADVAYELSFFPSISALIIPLHQDHTNLRDQGLGTSTDDELLAASPDWNRDLSVKRNLGLTLARMLGWKRLMFLDDDIQGVGPDDIANLAAGLERHEVAALIPTHFPENSVVCHARRLSGQDQDIFPSASALAVRCDGEALAFFPNIYNEDWFFFADQARTHKISGVGVSCQLPYDPYEDPMRARQEEFGDLLAEGLYALLDDNKALTDATVHYWEAFIKARRKVLKKVRKRLRVSDHPSADKALRSVTAARSQLGEIKPALCERFVEVWQSDLREWQEFLQSLPRVSTTREALAILGLNAIHVSN